MNRHRGILRARRAHHKGAQMHPDLASVHLYDGVAGNAASKTREHRARRRRLPGAAMLGFLTLPGISRILLRVNHLAHYPH